MSLSRRLSALGPSAKLAAAARRYERDPGEGSLLALAGAVDEGARLLVAELGGNGSAAINLGRTRYQACYVAAKVGVGMFPGRARPMSLAYPSLVRDGAVVSSARVFGVHQSLTERPGCYHLSKPLFGEDGIPYFSGEGGLFDFERFVTVLGPELGYARYRYRKGTGPKDTRYDLRPAAGSDLVAFARDFQWLVSHWERPGLHLEVDGHWWWFAPLVYSQLGDRLERRFGFDALLAAAERVWSRERAEFGEMIVDYFHHDPEWMKMLEKELRSTAPKKE